MPATATDTGLAAPWEHETPRETRRRLNRLERWLASTAAGQDPARVLYLRSLFEVAFKPEHADVLAGELRVLGCPLPAPDLAPTAFST